MDARQQELGRLSKKTLSKSIGDVQKIIDELEAAKRSIGQDPDNAAMTLAKSQNSVKSSFDGLKKSLLEVYTGQKHYAKQLDEKFKGKTLPTSDYDALGDKQVLINRAIGMHLLREGHFSVASMFLAETQRKSEADWPPAPAADTDLQNEEYNARLESLKGGFEAMYHILDEMKNKHNLGPATRWASERSAELEARGSNLEFELVRLQFLHLYADNKNTAEMTPLKRQQLALQFARTELASFQGRYLRELQKLAAAMAWSPNHFSSRYRSLFHSSSTWEEVATSFTREYCSMLGLSADSPLYIAATAGAIALPKLQKMQMIMEKNKTEWTSVNELPAEIPLPPSYRFHSIFVCPVSKEQTTDENPPMMLPCGHAIANESLQKLSKANRFKCPYCPRESTPREAVKLVL